MYYVLCEDGNIEHTRHDGREQFLITISSTGDPTENATIDLGGRTEMLREMKTEEYDPFCELIKENFMWFEEMDPDDAEEHIRMLSDAWGIPVKDLEYLR